MALHIYPASPSRGLMQKKPGRFYPARLNYFWLQSRGRNQLTLYVASGHAERTERCTEQHDCGATVRNALTAWAKEGPTGKAILPPSKPGIVMVPLKSPTYQTQRSDQPGPP